MSCRAVPKLSAWIDEQDWKETRELLYSADVEQVKEGCLQVRVWMDRGKVPTAVESTVNFLEVVLNDPEFVSEFLSTRSSDSEVEREMPKTTTAEKNEGPADTFRCKTLKLAYCTAIIRFVNELVDQAQKSTYATSITKLADQIGLPRFFVDIRHDGTHDQLPSLELLRWAAAQAVEWLEAKYWSCCDDRNDAEEMKESVHKSIDAFLEQLAKIPGRATITPSLEKNVMSRIIVPVSYLLTVERVMSMFLDAVASYPRDGGEVIETVIRLLARMSSLVFAGAFAKLWISAPRGSPIVSLWVEWIARELTVDSAQHLLPRILQTFAANASEEAFKEKLLPLWKHTAHVNAPLESLFSVFSRAYTSMPNGPVPSCLAKSQQIIQSRTLSLPEDLDDWTELPDTWKSCPLGK